MCTLRLTDVKVAPYRPKLPALQKLGQFLIDYASRKPHSNSPPIRLKLSGSGLPKLGGLTHKQRLWPRWPDKSVLYQTLTSVPPYTKVKCYTFGFGVKREDLTHGQIDPKGTHPPRNTFLDALSEHPRFSG